MSIRVRWLLMCGIGTVVVTEAVLMESCFKEVGVFDKGLSRSLGVKTVCRVIVGRGERGDCPKSSSISISPLSCT